MSVSIKVEAATQDGRLIGYRIRVDGRTGSGHSLLVWEDQCVLPGFRIGDEFVASPGKAIDYSTKFENGDVKG